MRTEERTKRPEGATFRPGIALLAWVLRRLRRLRPTRSGESEEPETARVGREGEEAAYFTLRRHGYIVVARRWMTATVDGEVDLIAWHENTLCFAEVKTRSRRDAFLAEFAVDEKKMRTMRRMAEAYVRRLPLRRQAPESIPIRFDVVSVYLREGERPEVQVMADAFR